jgi:predicted transglutaminase-like cysteine proteinase
MATRAWGMLLAAAGFVALSITGAQAGGSFMTTRGQTTQPVGHYVFCQDEPQECRQKTPKQAPVELTRELWTRIIEINNSVNAAVRPKTDFEIWGVEERWSYPVNGVGDCEDYVLEKRRQLAALGIPIGNLLITVVRQRNGDGHAILTVHTHLGDFVLDNLEPRVLAWHDTGYSFLKRQSAQNSGVWVAIEDDRSIAVGSVRRR